MTMRPEQYPVALVKVFQGIIECVEIHPTLDSAWESLRKWMHAPDDATWDQWDAAHTTDDVDSIPDWYSQDYEDSRVLDVEPSGRAAMRLSHVITFD